MTKFNGQSAFWKHLLQFIFILIFLSSLLVTDPIQSTFAKSEDPAPQPDTYNAPLFAAPAPSVSVSAGSVTVGSNFTITATFDSAGDTGYGPFIDLYIPRTGADGVYPGTTAASHLTSGIPDGNQYDGIFAAGPDTVTPDSPAVNFTATYQGTALTVYTQTFPNSGGGTGCVNHPVGLDTSGNFLQVCGKTGDQLVTAILPFGSFTAGQPPITIQIPAFLSNLADVGATALAIRARGGFQFGATPTVDWCCTVPKDTTILSDIGAPTFWFAHGDVTPTVFSFTKSGAADTATGPNYPQTYTLTVDIAEGQTLTNIDITDSLPNNIFYNGGLSSTPAASSFTQPSLGVHNLGSIQLHYNSFTSLSSGHTIVVTFKYYIPQFDATTTVDVVPKLTGTPTSTVNNASVNGTWTPIDLRDSPAPVSGTGVGTGTNRALKAGKTSSIVDDVGPSNTSPGDIVQYVINADISDYFAFDQLVAQDTIGDGQHFYTDGSHLPHLVIQENGSTPTFNFQLANYTVKCNYTGGPGPECKDGTNGSLPAGDTQAIFNISPELVSNSLSDQVLGGLIPDGGSANDGKSSIQIVFYTKVLDHYTDQFSGTNLKQGDALGDDATVTGSLLDIGTCNPGPCSPYSGNPTVTHGGSGGVSVPKGTLTKSIYAVNGTACSPQPCTNVNVAPGDTVTYRMSYNLVLGDFATLTLTDFLPLPIFKSDDPNADGTPPAWSKDTVTVNSIPVSGKWHLGPADTRAIEPGSVAVSGYLANNTVTFDFGSYDDPLNTPTVIDLLFTVTVTHDPFADRLLMTNQAQEADFNSSPVATTASQIIQLTLTEPVLVSKKSVVSTNHAGINPSPAIPGPISFTQPGNVGQPWTAGQIISSNYLGATNNNLNSNISGVDGTDLVKFAIVVQNTGSSANGAYDLIIKDTLPAGYILPNNGIQNINLQVYRGDGTALNFVNAGGGTGLLDQGIQIVDPANDPSIPISDPTYGHGACQAHDATNGKNVILVTYDLEVDPNVAPGQFIQNLGQLTHYSGSEGGPNYLPTPQTDSANTTIGNFGLAKTLLGSEVNNAHNSNTQVVIGELAHYQLVLTMPEGISPNTVITDTLPAGLAFVTADTFTNSDTTHLSYTGSDTPVITSTGQTVTINLGTVTNTDTVNSTAQTLTWEYTVVVLNVPSNSASITLRNAADVKWDSKNQNGTTVSRTVGPVHAGNVTVIESAITTTKAVSVANADAGDTVSYTVTLTNTGGSGTDAFDVTWADTVPTGLTYVTSSLAFGTCDASTVTKSVSAAGANLTALLSNLAYGASCEIKFDVKVDSNVTPLEVITNTANTGWTSLDSTLVNTFPRTSNNTNSTERVYSSQGSVDVTVNNTNITKQITATSFPYTTGTDVTIGEEVTYALLVSFPEGVTPTDKVVDQLPSGLELVSGTPEVITTSAGSGGLLTANFSGAFGTTPAITEVSGNAGSVTFDFANVVLPGDNISANNTLMLRYRARVTSDASNLNGGTISNSATNQVGNATAVLSNIVDVTLRDFVKGVSNTNVDSTAYNATDNVEEVAIGEIVTYKIDITVPRNSTDTAIITDTLDSGLAFVDCSQMMAGSNITSTKVDFTDSSNCKYGQASGSNPLISNTGHTISFDLGTISNGGSTTQTITLTYNVVVLNIATNVQAVVLNNNVVLTDTGGTVSRQGIPSLRIVQPQLQVVKTVDPQATHIGGLVTYSIDISHTDASLMTAYDVRLTDGIPTGLAFVPGSVQITGWGAGPPFPTVAPYVRVDADPAQLTVYWSEFPLGEKATVTFQAAFTGPAPVFNSANVEWKSIQIDPVPAPLQSAPPVPQSTFNNNSTERRFQPNDTLNNYVASSTVRLDVPPGLPRTGFAPGQITVLQQQPKDFAYTPMSDLWLEIPKLGVKEDIVGVPFDQKDWNLTWLGRQAGYLDGTAYPTHNGNSVITAHAYLADGTAGPFVKLNSLSYGDQVIVHLGGQKYIYQVRENLRVRPDNISVLKHEEKPWLTLITCQTYNEQAKDYIYRIAIRAVLVKIE